jgi:hypothetical protein
MHKKFNGRIINELLGQMYLRFYIRNDVPWTRSPTIDSYQERWKFSLLCCLRNVWGAHSALNPIAIREKFRENKGIRRTKLTANFNLLSSLRISVASYAESLYVSIVPWLGVGIKIKYTYFKDCHFSTISLSFQEQDLTDCTGLPSKFTNAGITTGSKPLRTSRRFDYCL